MRLKKKILRAAVLGFMGRDGAENGGFDKRTFALNWSRRGKASRGKGKSFTVREIARKSQRNGGKKGYAYEN